MTDLSVPPVSASILADAEHLLLAPSGLDQSALSSVLADIHSHDVDFADLYFQHARFEGWSLEEGIVKSGSFNIDRGVGVRAVSGDKQAYAYSDDISLAALTEAAHAVRAIGRQGQSAVAPLGQRGGARALYAQADPVGEPRRCAQGGAARTARAPGARARSARDARDGVARRRARDDPHRAQRRPGRRRRPAARADVDHGDRRGERPARAGLRRRRRPLRLRAISRTTCSPATRRRRSDRRSSTCPRARRRPAT